jgi:manganese/zinc/iron transport system permease protein
MQLLQEIVTNYTLRNVVLGAMVLGITNGALGAFAVLRKQSLLGDTISHAALPGIALAFILSGSRAPLILMIGAGLAGWLGTYLMLSIINHTRIKEDAALGIILSVFFGIGLVFLKVIERGNFENSAGFNKILFGQAASLMQRDVIVVSITGAVALIILFLFWKEFALMTFNPEFGASLGFSKRFTDILLISLIVVSIVIGLQTVGVVLMSAVIVIPATAARQWTNRLGPMVALSAFFGAVGGVGGVLVSRTASEAMSHTTKVSISPGPTIVLCLGAITALSLVIAPGRGILWEFLRRRRNRQRFHLDGILLDLYLLSTHHDDFSYEHSIKTLQTMRPNKEGVQLGLEFLAEKGYVTDAGNGFWSLTASGLDHAKKVQFVQLEDNS